LATAAAADYGGRPKFIANSLYSNSKCRNNVDALYRFSRNMFGYWHDPVVCLSVRLSVYVFVCDEVYSGKIIRRSK